MHDSGVAGVVEVIGVTGRGVDHRCRHRVSRFTGYQQCSLSRGMGVERMATHPVGQRRTGSGDDDSNGVENTALGLVQNAGGDVVERQPVTELDTLVDGGGHVVTLCLS